MNTEELKKLWRSVTDTWSERDKEWHRIEAAYQEPGRHYHTLQHLCEVHTELQNAYGEAIPTSTVFALFYHDLVYNVLRFDNEKQSAIDARKNLSWLHSSVTNKIYNIIIATADHKSSDMETMLFLDADMAILGAEESRYQDYIDKVRREYSIYPDILYRRGRRKFIEATLKRDKMFLTWPFQSKYETQARTNLTNELKLLQ